MESIKLVKTSISHPIYADFIDKLYVKIGKLGMTICPGKK